MGLLVRDDLGDYNLSLKPAIILLLSLVALLWPSDRAMSETDQASHTATSHPPVHKVTTTATQGQITVWGHRRQFCPAPMADNRLVEPGTPSGFGPGYKLGLGTIEGGPVHDQIHNGVSAGIAIPTAVLPGLDFMLNATGSRDAMTASGTNGAASATAGFRLKF